MYQKFLPFLNSPLYSLYLYKTPQYVIFFFSHNNCCLQVFYTQNKSL